jgi:hypothetical protein
VSDYSFEEVDLALREVAIGVGIDDVDDALARLARFVAGGEVDDDASADHPIVRSFFESYVGGT